MKQKVKKQLLRRLKILEGQIRGLSRLVENETYCVDVLTQTSAAKQALSRVEDLLLENHLATHVVGQVKSGETKKASKELLAVYRLAKKK